MAAHRRHPALIPAPIHPSHASLINHCLLPKITGQQQQLLHAGFLTINEADVYSKPPHQLVTEHAPAHGGEGGTATAWYFFTRLRYTSENQRRRSRTVVAGGMVGRWHPETGKKEVNGTVGGYIKRFCYKEKAAAEWVRTGWLMAEYSYSSSDTVLCKVYIRSHQESSSAAQTTTTPTARAQRRAAAPAASGYQGTLQGALGPLQEAERFLMIDDDDDGRGLMMALQIPPHHEDMDAFFESYLFGGGGEGGVGDEQHETAPLYP